VVAFVGVSGSGKSTLVSLIPRYYDHSQGEILLDGREIKDYKLKNLRQHIALVSQDVVLFNDTVRRNIAYGNLAVATEAEVVNAATMANALEFIQQMPQKFDTMIGEDGSRLSGGQRQRLSIARAILKNAPILVFDEATSALDTESEKQIQAALEKVSKGRTTLIIAHRLSTIEKADKIVVMKEGKIVEIGKHQQLLANKGEYAKLYNMQFLNDASESAL
jgi:subfamily B ATP-binding cassette protein MsbA